MGLLRRQQLGQAVATACATFYPGSGVNGTGATVVSFDGGLASVVYLPACYLDEILLRDRQRNAWALLDEIDHFVQAVPSPEWPTPFRTNVVPLVEQWDGKPLCEVVTAMQPTYASFTTYKPRLAAPKVLQPTFYAYWDAVMALGGEDVEGLAANLLTNLAYQSAYYRDNGLPKWLGRAPTYAAARGASDRLADEIGEAVGLTGEQLRALPQAERDRIIEEHTLRNS